MLQATEILMGNRGREYLAIPPSQYDPERLGWRGSGNQVPWLEWPSEHES
jgi:hypothetical protein